MQTVKYSCQDCGPLAANHIQNWIDEYFYLIVESWASKLISSRIKSKSGDFINKYFLRMGLLKRETKPDPSGISLRSKVFLDELNKRRIKWTALKSELGPITRFEIDKNGKKLIIDGLPRAEFLESGISDKIDDKYIVKNILMKNGIPTPLGRGYWFFDSAFAVGWVLKNLKFPLTVKPRFGSMSHHISLNIQNKADLKSAIKKSLKYSPSFIVEEYIPNVSTYRITVVDYKNLACAKRVPAHVIGNGTDTIQKLIDIKNEDPRRGIPRAKDSTIFKITIDDVAEVMLRKSGFSLGSIPAKGEIVFLQEKVILDLGADLFEETDRMHPDNRKLFERVARIFNVKLVGIDFLIDDIGKSWKSSKSAIIELNSLPYIDMHQFPTEGEPVNVAGFVCDMFEKYY